MTTDSNKELLAFRTRWRRWLGQKTRRDMPTWVTLLDCNWSGWAEQVLEAHASNLKQPRISDAMPDQKIKEYFRAAIDCADMRELQRLDGMYCAQKAGLMK